MPNEVLICARNIVSNLLWAAVRKGVKINIIEGKVLKISELFLYS
jgi:hypothetical protein